MGYAAMYVIMPMTLHKPSCVVAKSILVIIINGSYGYTNRTVECSQIKSVTCDLARIHYLPCENIVLIIFIHIVRHRIK